MRYFLWYVAVINIVTFVVFLTDKIYAKRQMWRVPERTLMFLALIGGSVGALMAMQIFRHKTKHTKFMVGIPLILSLQLLLLYLCAVYFNF